MVEEALRRPPSLICMMNRVTIVTGETRNRVTIVTRETRNCVTIVTGETRNRVTIVTRETRNHLTLVKGDKQPRYHSDWRPVERQRIALP